MLSVNNNINLETLLLVYSAEHQLMIYCYSYCYCTLHQLLYCYCYSYQLQVWLDLIRTYFPTMGMDSYKHSVFVETFIWNICGKKKACIFFIHAFTDYKDCGKPHRFARISYASESETWTCRFCKRFLSTDFADIYIWCTFK